MSRWHPTARPETYRRLSIAATVALIAGVALATLATPAAGQADLSLGSLDVADSNATVDGDVSDVQLAADLDYSHTVPDAERRIVKLRVGTSDANLETIAYRQARSPSGSASGSVNLVGSLLDHPSFDAESVTPETADTTSGEILVRAVIEVPRAGGDAVTHSVTDTATVTIQDGAEVTVEVGGTGAFTVESA